MNGVKFFTVIALVLAVTGLLLGTGCSSNTKFISTTTGSVTPNIEFTTVLGSTANPIAPILLIADSFIIVPNTSENEAEWEGQNITDFTQLTLPYVSYGHYISKPFFVNNGETLQVIMNSAVPASDMANNGGLDTELMLAESGTAGLGSVISSNSTRTQDGFTTKIVYSISTTGDYYYGITNDSMQNSNCQVNISILK